MTIRSPFSLASISVCTNALGMSAIMHDVMPVLGVNCCCYQYRLCHGHRVGGLVSLCVLLLPFTQALPLMLLSLFSTRNIRLSNARCFSSLVRSLTRWVKIQLCHVVVSIPCMLRLFLTVRFLLAFS